MCPSRTAKNEDNTPQFNSKTLKNPQELNISNQATNVPKQDTRSENSNRHTSPAEVEATNQEKEKRSYAGTLSLTKDKNTVLCNCNPQSPKRAIQIPLKSANTYRVVTDTLNPYGTVEAITLDPISQLHTALYKCGCQASTAKNRITTITDPFIPPPNFISEYNPGVFQKHDSKLKSPPIEETTPKSAPPIFPKIFRVIPKRKPQHNRYFSIPHL